MANELPYMQFYPADWLADCDVLSVGARGAWQTFLCKAWLARNASITLKIPQWCRVFGATNAEQAERVIAEIEECEVGDVIRQDDGRVTLISRRIERDLAAMGATQKKRSDAARMAAESRWNAERMRNASEPHTEGNADAMRNDAIPEDRSQIRERESAGADRPASKPPAGDPKTIVDAYPRREKVAECLAMVAKHLADGEDFEAMLAGTRACAAVIRTLPSGHLNRYVPSAGTFFTDKRWKDDPETLRRQGSPTTGQAKIADDEIDRMLGRRANPQPDQDLL